MKVNLPVSGCAVEFSANANILSTTNPKGAMTYVHPDFINISGVIEAELLGVNHNIVRRFAVVADEVRGLASRTQQSTAEIHGTIDTLRRSTGDAVVAMQRSHSKAEASVEQALFAARALDGITQRVGEISEMSVQIAAVEEQSAVGDSIQCNLNGISQAPTVRCLPAARAARLLPMSQNWPSAFNCHRRNSGASTL